MSGLHNLLSLELEPHEMADKPAGHEFSGRSITDEVGARLTGIGVYELPPGQTSWPYHFELADEEWAIVITGEVTLRTPAGERTLRRGDVVCFPPGPEGAHLFRNDGAETVRFAMPSTIPQGADACVYPDSGKVKVSGPGFMKRIAVEPERGYWEGEQ
jgi:uncharacterized cupin superfamily protein